MQLGRLLNFLLVFPLITGIFPNFSGGGKKMFLHGQLKIHVIKAYDLPDTDTAFFNIDGKDVTGIINDSVL